MYRIDRSKSKIQSLLHNPKNLFTVNDLATLWNISSKNTLWKTLSRYVKKGLLFRIYRGLYSKIPVEDLFKEELGCALMGPFSYISLETVLSKEGIIMQQVYPVTLVGKIFKEVTLEDGTRYTCKQMSEKYLLDREGILDLPAYSIATPERALADLQYLKKHYYVDYPQAVDISRVSDIKKEVGY